MKHLEAVTQVEWVDLPRSVGLYVPSAFHLDTGSRDRISQLLQHSIYVNNDRSPYCCAVFLKPLVSNAAFIAVIQTSVGLPA